MTVKELIRKNAELARMITKSYLGDMTDADLLTRVSPQANHVAWQLGHLIASEAKALLAMGYAVPELPAGFAAAHTKETATSADPNKFGTKAQYLDLMDRVRSATLAALDAVPEEKLDQPGPEEMRSYAATVGDVFMLTGSHELMHVGQFACLRRHLNKPIVM